MSVVNNFYGKVLLSLCSVCLVSCEQNRPKRVDSSQDCIDAASGKKFCATTFAAIAANPQVYDGREVAVNGYLVIDGGVLSLYFDENSYIHKMVDGNLLTIRAPVEKQKELFDKYGYAYVNISGVYVAAKLSGKSRYGLGSIGGELSAFPLPNRAGPRDREGWDQIRIELEDISPR